MDSSEFFFFAGHNPRPAARRSAISLIGRDKTGDDRWYDVHVPIADQLYDEHLEQLRKKGLIDD
ncbi:MAG: hypothetical protein L0H15_02740 [Nitrosospira sp.]|nr:hypothetical protein [Nitrosospira sp.]MDN5881600.1 hypothetical protein [Nitrosospira sp.]